MTEPGELLLDAPATRPCVHRRVQHEHGTEGRHTQDGCKCAECRAAHDDYVAEHPMVRRHGAWLAFADAGPVRAHVRQLLKTLSTKTIAERAQVSEQTVKTLLHGRDGTQIVRVRDRTARQLLAVHAGRHTQITTPDLLTEEN